MSPPTTPGIRALVWDEHGDHVPRAIYPRGIRGALAAALERAGLFRIDLAHLDEPQQGLSAARLDTAEVLLWWGHRRHAELADGRVAELVARVHAGRLGLVALHSGHHSKPFRQALGASGDLGGGWDEDGGPEQVRVCAPWHPVAAGVQDFELAAEELYAAPFCVPPPEAVVLQSFFPRHGKGFPSGLVWRAGEGRVAYLRFGHESCPSLCHPLVQRLIANAAAWAAGAQRRQ